MEKQWQSKDENHWMNSRDLDGSFGLPWWLSGKEHTCQCRRLGSLGREDPLEKEMATRSSILAWEIPGTEEPGRLQSSSVQSLSCVQLFATLWTAAHQAFLSITNSWSLLKLMFIVSVMPSNHLILCHSLLLLPSISPSIRVFHRVSSFHQMAKVLELQLHHCSFQWIFRVDFL